MDIRGVNLTGINIIDKYRVPDAPIIGTATAIDASTATVTFTQPNNDGNQPITTYTAVSSPGGITGTVSQSGSGTITVSGLSALTSYTFIVYATNSIGNSSYSNSSNQITTPVLPSQRLFTTTGSVNWTVPAGVYTISVVCVGGGGGGAGVNGTPLGYGGGGGGGLGYKNNISVTPGQSITVYVGSQTATNNSHSSQLVAPSSYISIGGTQVCVGGGGVSGLEWQNGSGGSFVGDGGGNGGDGGVGVGTNPYLVYPAGGGGGAGGYGANTGGTGGSGRRLDGAGIAGVAGTNGGGGGGGGCYGTGYGGRGGGVGLYGQGGDGAGGSYTSGAGYPGGDGSNGSNGLYGAGGGGASNTAQPGAVRIIWPGDQRYFPSTRTADE